MPEWPDWLTYDTIKAALRDLGGPYADELGLAIIVICVAGLAVHLIIKPLRRR